MHEIFLRCNIEQLKANIIQVIQTRQAYNISNFFIEKLLQLANLIVMTTNLLPEAFFNDLKRDGYFAFSGLDYIFCKSFLVSPFKKKLSFKFNKKLLLERTSESFWIIIIKKLY